MPVLLKPSAEKLKGKLPAAKSSIENLLKLTKTPLKAPMVPGIEGEAENLSKQMEAQAEAIKDAFEDFQASLMKVLAKA